MAYFPFMVDVDGWHCLVAGGGRVACRKVKALQDFGMHIRVIAEEFWSGWTTEMANCELVKRTFRDSDIEGMNCVVAATDDEKLNSHISLLCKKKGIPVNVVDKEEECSFLFPAMVKEGDLLIAVSTGGKSPAMAAYVKKQLQDQLPEYYGDMVEILGRYRDFVSEQLDTQKERKTAFDRLVEYGEENTGLITKEVVDGIIKEVRETGEG